MNIPLSRSDLTDVLARHPGMSENVKQLILSGQCSFRDTAGKTVALAGSPSCNHVTKVVPRAVTATVAATPVAERTPAAKAEPPKPAAPVGAKTIDTVFTQPADDTTRSIADAIRKPVERVVPKGLSHEAPQPGAATVNHIFHGEK